MTTQAITVIKYEIVEDWFFDKRRSKDGCKNCFNYPNCSTIDGTDFETELGTFYYPEIRRFLANHKVYNTA